MTDQWREIVWWLGRFEDVVLLLLSARVPVPEAMDMLCLQLFVTRLMDY